MNRIKGSIIHRLAILLLAGFLLSACAPTAEGPFADYYVSPTGSDSSGDGSEARPWQTIQFGSDNADYSGRPVQFHIAAGTYTENLNISQSAIFRGAGSGDPGVDTGLTIIEWGSAPVSGGAHMIQNSDVEIYDLVFIGGRVWAETGRLVVQNVWFDSIEFFGLWLQDIAAFSIIDSEFHSTPDVSARVGVNVIDSTGEITNGYYGDYLNYGITILRNPTSGEMVVTVDGAVVRGSPICQAAGILVYGSPVVTILNSDIRREHAEVEAACGSWGEPSASRETFSNQTAGIGIATQHSDPRSEPTSHTVRGNVVSGFDAGMAFDLERTRVRVEENDISGLSYGVYAFDSWLPSPFNVLDFGGGSMGSAGSNIFRDIGDYAFYLHGEHEVTACDNDWVVPAAQIDPDRIYDQLDRPSSSRVIWSCTSAPIEAGTIETEVPDTTTLESIPSATALTNSSCREGADAAHEVHNFLYENQTALVIGRMSEGTWVYVELPDELGRCWIFSENLDLTGPVDSLPLFTSPELPTTDDGGGDDGGGDEGGGNDGGGEGSAPAAPSNASISNRTCDSEDYFFTIEWQDNANNEDGFRILRDGELIATVGANVESYLYTPPGSGPYTFTIEAFNDNGSGETTVQEAVCFV